MDGCFNGLHQSGCGTGDGGHDQDREREQRCRTDGLRRREVK